MDEQNRKQVFVDTMKSQGGHAPAVADEEIAYQWAHLPNDHEPDPEEHAMRVARTYQ